MPSPDCIIMVILIIIGYNSHKVKESSFSSFLKKKLAASLENLLLGKIKTSLDIILSFYYKTSLHQYTIWEKHLYIFLPRQTQTEEEEIDSQSEGSSSDLSEFLTIFWYFDMSSLYKKKRLYFWVCWFNIKVGLFWKALSERPGHQLF